MESLNLDLHAAFRAANDPDTSPSELAKLAQHSEEVVRQAVLFNSSADANTLELLKRDCKCLP